MQANPIKRHILVTSALPYANGPIHIGHLLEYIQTDIWVRWQKLCGHQCYYICADDAHGTPIMLHAKRQGITPESLIEKTREEHITDFSSFFIEFDEYYSTHTEENRDLVSEFYQRLKDRQHIYKKTIRQAYDPIEKIFLPDRFIRGECPNCQQADQYGDSCENCGATYEPTDLKNPISALSGTTPILKQTEHYFFKLVNFTDILKKWMSQSRLQSEVVNKLQEWFIAGLKDWNISRDAPYFGFQIPDAPGKYFYVWLDAPVAYLATFKKLCKRLKIDFAAWCATDSDKEMYHFIGKDIIYFHTLFWPAVLSGSQLRMPSAVFAHGFLTVNGKKMSKTRGTFITAKTFQQHLNPEYLRYYFATKLGSSIEDIDLHFPDFMQRINSDLVGKVINIASRCAKFINTRFENQLATDIHQPDLLAMFMAEGKVIEKYYEQREYAKGMRAIMALADKANQYIDACQPWVVAKSKDEAHELQLICTMGLNLFRLLILYLKPVLPITAQKAEHFLNIKPLMWQHINDTLTAKEIRPFTPLLNRVQEQMIKQVLHDSIEDLTSTSKDENKIGIDDFAKVDLRVGKIINCQEVQSSDKLLQLTVDVGQCGQLNIFAGIKSSYQPDSLIGRLTIVVVNLKPRKMRFGTSQGMVLAAGQGGQELFILSPDKGAVPGMEIK